MIIVIAIIAASAYFVLQRNGAQQSNATTTPITSSPASTTVVTTTQHSSPASAPNPFLTPFQVSLILGAGWNYTSSGNITQTAPLLSYNFTGLFYENSLLSPSIKVFEIGVHDFSDPATAESFVNEIMHNNNNLGLSLQNGTSGQMTYVLASKANATSSEEIMYVSINNTGIIMDGGSSVVGAYVFNLSQGLELASAEYSQQLGKSLAYSPPKALGTMEYATFACYGGRLFACTVNLHFGNSSITYVYNGTLNLTLSQHIYSTSSMKGPITVYLVGGENYMSNFTGACSLPYCASDTLSSTAQAQFINGTNTNVLIYNASHVELYSQNGGHSYSGGIWLGFYSNNTIKYAPFGTLVIT